MANKWEVPGHPNATKKQVIESYKYEVQQARLRLANIGLSSLKLDIPETLPTNGAQALARVKELRKINDLDIIVVNGTYHGTIGNPSRYLYIQESITKEIKTHKWSKDYKKFSAKEANKLIAEQKKVNKARRKKGLEPISGLRFDKKETIEDITKNIKFKGSDLGIAVEQQQFIDNIKNSLESAKQKSIDTGLYTSETIEMINKLITKINSESDSYNYNKLWKIYKQSNDKELYNIFSSDQTLFQQTILMDKLATAYNISINIDIDFSSEDVLF